MALKPLTPPQLNLFIQRLNKNPEFSYYLDTLHYFLTHDLDTTNLIDWWNNNNVMVSAENPLDEFTTLLERIHIDEDDLATSLKKNIASLKEKLSIEQAKRNLPDSLDDLEKDIHRNREELTSKEVDYPEFRHVPWMYNLVDEFNSVYGSINILKNLAMLFDAYLPDTEKQEAEEDYIGIFRKAWLRIDSQNHHHIINLAIWVCNHSQLLINKYLLKTLLLFLLNKKQNYVSANEIYRFAYQATQRLCNLILAKFVREKIICDDNTLFWGSKLDTEYQPSSQKLAPVITKEIFTNLCKLVVNNQVTCDSACLQYFFLPAYTRVMLNNQIIKVWPGAGEIFRRLLDIDGQSCEDPSRLEFAMDLHNPPLGCVLDYLNQYHLSKLNLTCWRLHDLSIRDEDKTDESMKKYNYSEDIKYFFEIWFAVAEYMEISNEQRGACLMRIFALLLLYAAFSKMDLVNQHIDERLDNKKQLFNPWYFRSVEALKRLANGDLSICKYNFG